MSNRVMKPKGQVKEANFYPFQDRNGNKSDRV